MAVLLAWDFADGTDGPFTTESAGTWTVIAGGADYVLEGTSIGGSVRYKFDPTVYGAAGQTVEASTLIMMPALSSRMAGLHIASDATGAVGLQAVINGNNGSGSSAPFQMRNNMSSTPLASSTAPTIAANTWYRIEMTWEIGVSLEARLYENASNTLLATLLSTAAAVTSKVPGGVGFVTYNNGVQFDDLRLATPDIIADHAYIYENVQQPSVGEAAFDWGGWQFFNSQGVPGGGTLIEPRRVVPVTFPFQYLRRYDDELGSTEVFTPEQADILEDRDQALERYLQETMPDLMFSLPGPLYLSISPKYRARATYRIDTWIVTLVDAPADPVEAWVLVNGVRRVDISMGVGVDEREIQQHILLEKGRDHVQVQIVDAGRGASGMNVQGLLRH